MCCLCSQTLRGNNELLSHIRMKHSKEFNCTECECQASSAIILNKHLNLKHTKQNDPEKNTLKCGHCNHQFSALWNLKKHKRDEHDIVDECIFLKRGIIDFQHHAGINTQLLSKTLLLV